ncbi:protein giant-like [Orussus abietinus]|uniref:protein giant-like n=1 Tax=Orussus abietinus TaxID=222816 RepID=UPI000626459F|nr:protein giant-like [Orussus abietinus]XP_012278838.1 protein giant-like [Orussus abietinus]
MDPSYLQSQAEVQALDFTSSIKPEISELPIEPPILDLSCKKPNSSVERVTTPLEELSSSSMSEKPQSSHLSDQERKSPFEGRTFMVTPPSETDSPKKVRYEPIYKQVIAASPEIMNRHPYPAMMPVGIPIPVPPEVLPAFLTQSNVSSLPTKPIQMPATSNAGSQEVSQSSASSDVGKKAPRPFKAYPKDPLALTMGTAELMYDQNSNEAYSEFRKRMLESVRRTNDGTNIKMRRASKSPGLPTSTVDEKDAAYWERRRKNNEAAKRSRDARRAKEDEIAIRAAFLEQENMKLKYELVALRNETAKLRCMVYST